MHQTCQGLDLLSQRCFASCSLWRNSMAPETQVEQMQTQARLKFEEEEHMSFVTCLHYTGNIAFLKQSCGHYTKDRTNPLQKYEANV